jgi:hypothetical protein
MGGNFLLERGHIGKKKSRILTLIPTGVTIYSMGHTIKLSQSVELFSKFWTQNPSAVKTAPIRRKSLFYNILILFLSIKWRETTQI